MSKPLTRQQLAKLIVERLYAPMQPIPPLPSPCEPGFLMRKQGGDPR